MSAHVAVSHHALDRARERYADRKICRAEIAAVVGAAVDGGRVAKRLPGNPNIHVDRTLRIAWSPDKTRVYVVRRARSRVDGSPVWVVVTALDNEYTRRAVA